MKKLGLYIHIPFCIKKCGYCDFLSFEYTAHQLEHYLIQLKKEIQMQSVLYHQYEVCTLYIGGGTPSLLSGNQMQDLMETIKAGYRFSDDVEISMEANPGTLDEMNLMAYKKAGINRISLGVQTLETRTLLNLDRIHTVDMVYDAVKDIKMSGFENFNMDLMFGLPGQTLKELKHTVDEMIRLNPTHISAYSLKYEEGTVFYKKLQAGEMVEMEDELDREMYHFICDALAEAGYTQYEISNFAKNGYICRHNMVYWEKVDYLGLGLGSHSCIEQKRFYNVSDLASYGAKIEGNLLPVEGEEIIDDDGDVFETIILNLRLNKGLNLKTFKIKYGFDLRNRYRETIESLMDDGLIVIENNHILLTGLGRDLSNQVFIKFLN